MSVETNKNEIIICSAVKRADTGQVYYGHRHHQCISAANDEMSWKMSREQMKDIKLIQGFITNENRFVDREEAFVIALKNNQILKDSENYGRKLYSENLY